MLRLTSGAVAADRNATATRKWETRFMVLILFQRFCGCGASRKLLSFSIRIDAFGDETAPHEQYKEMVINERSKRRQELLSLRFFRQRISTSVPGQGSTPEPRSRSRRS